MHANPGILPSDLSEKLLCHRSNVTRLVRGLEKEGFIERRHGKADYRTIHLALTAKGTALFLQAQAAYEKYVHSRMRRVNSEEKQLLIDNLQSLFHLLKREAVPPLDTAHKAG